MGFCPSQGKVKADMVELEKLRTEGRKKTERAERLAIETEKQSKGCTDVVRKSSCPYGLCDIQCSDHVISHVTSHMTNHVTGLSSVM